MSWNGNDLFNSTLMGGMPSGADPHQYLTTDGNGMRRWEDKLAYEESAEVEIMPPTEVGRIWYSFVSVNYPFNGAIKVGDTGVMYLNGEPRKYTAIEKVYSGGPPVDVQLSVDGLPTTSGLIGLDSDGLFFYNVSIGSPSANHTVSITKSTTAIKPLDPKYLPSGSGGGGGVIYIENADSLINPAYSDETLTTKFSYEQVKEIIQKPYIVCAVVEGAFMGSFTPSAAIPDDEGKVLQAMLVGSVNGDIGIMPMTFTFSDTP